MDVGFKSCWLILTLVILGIAPTRFRAQDEHSQHHPASGSQATPGQAAPDAASPSQVTPNKTGVSQGEHAGGMMEHGASPAQKQLYPSLMNLPEISQERRVEIERQANERMQEGARLLSEALDEMSGAAGQKDYSRMQAASEKMREGMARFNSGLAAQRALQEGKAPRAIATEWFKREMNLPQEATPAESKLSPFHYLLMAFLVASTFALIWLQFSRLRRANRLLISLAAGATDRVTAHASTVAQQRSPPTTSQVPSTSSTIPAGRWSGQLRVIKIFQETPDVSTFRLAHPSGADLPFLFEPGQFLTISVSPDGKEVRRSYSIASSPCRRTWCEITVKRTPAGVVSGYLHDRVAVGNLISVSGPFGKFTFRGHEADSVVFIGGGVGITPLISSIRCLTDQAWAGDVFLIYACNTIQHIIFREELEYLVRRYPNLHVTLVLSDETSAEWKGERGRITKELLTRTVPNITSRRIHLCGPPPMMEAVKAILSEIGVSEGQVKSENFLGSETRPAPPTGAPVTDKVTARCTFARSQKSAQLPPDRSVLEVSEDIGVNIEYSCREGYCGVCKIKLLGGQVTMAIQEALTPEDKAASLILACQAKSDSDVLVDA